MRHVISFFVFISLFFSLISSAQEEKHLTQISKTVAVQKAKNTEKGRVLKVINKEQVYQIKMLQSSGRVIIVEVDKQSGKVKSRKVKH